jgi:hypothetical protein
MIALQFENLSLIDTNFTILKVLQQSKNFKSYSDLDLRRIKLHVYRHDLGELNVTRQTARGVTLPRKVLRRASQKVLRVGHWQLREAAAQV